MANDEIKIFKAHIVGTTPLLMHNGQLSDPLNDWTRQLKTATSNRNKSDEDHEEIGRIEFQGGLYFDDEMGPVIPGYMLDAMMIEGAKKRKLGTAFEPLVMTADPFHSLIYEGPRDRDGLWANKSFCSRVRCGVKQSAIMRTRPKFDDWGLEFMVLLSPGQLNQEHVRQAIEDAGSLVGLGDWRPKHGRFDLIRFEELKVKKPEPKEPKEPKKRAKAA